MKEKQKKCMRILRILLAVLFVCSAIPLCGVQPAFAAQPETVLTLDREGDVENVPFEVSNMFPGDLEINTYHVKVKTKDTVTVRFRVDIDDGCEKLAEVLKCRIVLKNTEETLFDGLLKDAPKAMDYTAEKPADGAEDLFYEISVSLDSSVGNEYQGRKLTANFVWWTEDADPSEPEDNNPQTGDVSNPILWGAIAACSALLMLVFMLTKRNRRQDDTHPGKAWGKVIAYIGIMLILVSGLSVTTYALLYPTVSVDGNSFQTGTVKINLNDDVPVITPDEFLFEPGMTVVKEFFVENEGTIDVYYRLYFSNVEGVMADVLEVTIKDSEQVLYHGKAAELTRENACLSENVLGVGEKVWLTLTFHYPDTEDNHTQRQFMDFDLCADAVQTKNNPNKLFD